MRLRERKLQGRKNKEGNKRPWEKKNMEEGERERADMG